MVKDDYLGIYPPEMVETPLLRQGENRRKAVRYFIKLVKETLIPLVGIGRSKLIDTGQFVAKFAVIGESLLPFLF